MKKYIAILLLISLGFHTACSASSGRYRRYGGVSLGLALGAFLGWKYYKSRQTTPEREQFKENVLFLVEAKKQFEERFPLLLGTDITLINIVTPTSTTKNVISISALAAALKVGGLDAFAQDFIIANSSPYLSVDQIKESLISALNNQNNYESFSDIAAFLSMDTESFLSAFIDAINRV